ncbi:MAG: phospho-sugar mutase [Alicyclobacillaceae bacterium]|nr:phospho-sugar mutase [Alicyclobacillaceae bacterium]
MNGAGQTAKWTEERRAHYETWRRHLAADPDLAADLERMEGDAAALYDAFCADLAFGTGGLRGVMGAGTNRMNRYTVRRATAGLARYLKKQGVPDRGVVVAYDSRRWSDLFAKETALTLAAAGIPVYLFDDIRPTPELSFAVRELGAAAGVVITASHNPPEYNGYKVYGPDGCQAVPELAGAIYREIAGVEDPFAVPVAGEEEARRSGLLRTIGREIDDRYIARVRALGLLSGGEERGAVTLVYTPLHGTGGKAVPRVLEEAGYRVVCVEEQMRPDPEFSTVASPNPEDPAAFERGLERAREVGADAVLATDPDCDRVGVAVPDGNGGYAYLTGNQIGVLLLDYILQRRKALGTAPEHGVMIKTIVTSEMGRAIAGAWGLETIDVLTGFKFIGEQIGKLEGTGRTFVFGYEESCGYLIGDFVRDKDGVQASAMVAEMIAYHKAAGKTLLDRLEELYKEYGYYRERLVSVTLPGAEGQARMAQSMSRWREAPPSEIAGLAVEEVQDYLAGRARTASGGERVLDLPKSDVLKFVLGGGHWFCLRPSGTEPKLKIYFGVRGQSGEEARELLERLHRAVMERVEGGV